MRRVINTSMLIQNDNIQTPANQKSLILRRKITIQNQSIYTHYCIYHFSDLSAFSDLPGFCLSGLPTVALLEVEIRLLIGGRPDERDDLLKLSLLALICEDFPIPSFIALYRKY